MSLLACIVSAWIDGDTLKAVCNGRPQHVRIAAAEANERHGGCHLPRCPALPHRAALAAATRIAPAGTVIRFQIVGASYDRVVGENMALRCALIRSGAAVSWESYRVRYGLRRCS